MGLAKSRFGNASNRVFPVDCSRYRKLQIFFAREANSSNGVTEFAMFELEMPYSSAWIVGAQVWVNIKAVYVEGVVSQGAKNGREPLLKASSIYFGLAKVLFAAARALHLFVPSTPLLRCLISEQSLFVKFG